MKVGKEIGELTRELERKQKPQNKDECFALHEYIFRIENTAFPVFKIAELIKEFENIKYMMSCYLPKFYQSQGENWSTAKDVTRDYYNLDNERKRLIAVLRKLKNVLEGLNVGEEPEQKSQD